MLHLIATIRIKPGTKDDVAKAAIPCIEATRKEEGCIRYDMMVDVMDETNVTFVEEWESRELLDRHVRSAHVKTWHEAGKPYIVSEHIAVIYPEKIEGL
ncbi:antibiotic biosynthesis monooxygenase [Aureimonas endophytica]|uniref:Antibiotic biosynthesis monooxygenase n=1 Tax=Aureimonas endophytica TaxID=2027858 RepID=A0A917A2F3_9HYPH|nr:putative quinol monooxygenase [Aureimonas endophytica]GGE22103.1 antibiotic biosynthesis monooxygenase [Aureimonas endophytica]